MSFSRMSRSAPRPLLLAGRCHPSQIISSIWARYFVPQHFFLGFVSVSNNSMLWVLIDLLKRWDIHSATQAWWLACLIYSKSQNQPKIAFKYLHQFHDCFISHCSLWLLDCKQGFLRRLHLWPVKDHHLQILHNMSGSVKAGRFTLLLG